MQITARINVKIPNIFVVNLVAFSSEIKLLLFITLKMAPKIRGEHQFFTKFPLVNALILYIAQKNTLRIKTAGAKILS